MKRVKVWVIGVGMGLGLAGCNETSGGPQPSFEAPPSPVVLSLPPGAACTREIGGYQKIVKSDLDTGNLEEKVYNQIETELARAEAACAAGKGSEAHGIVAASKSRHGYRV
jgi:ABC-type Zn uptake system ZnuABC Zn-binding protein ZnuA